VKGRYWYAYFILVCVAIGLSSVIYAVIRADPLLIIDDLRTESQYQRVVSSDVRKLNMATLVLERCGGSSISCESVANRVEIDTRAFEDDLARTHTPPCLVGLDRDLRTELQDLFRAAEVILADSSSDAARAQAVATVSVVRVRIAQTAAMKGRCGLGRLF